MEETSVDSAQCEARGKKQPLWVREEIHQVSLRETFEQVIFLLWHSVWIVNQFLSTRVWLQTPQSSLLKARCWYRAASGVTEVKSWLLGNRYEFRVWCDCDHLGERTAWQACTAHAHTHTHTHAAFQLDLCTSHVFWRKGGIRGSHQ